jgi:hypothetical protein
MYLFIHTFSHIFTLLINVNFISRENYLLYHIHLNNAEAETKRVI